MEEGVRDAEDQLAYAEAFKQQMVELAMTGRRPAKLARGFEVSAQSITAPFKTF